MSTLTVVARNLATAFLDGEWSPEELRQRGGLALGRKERWLAPLVRRVVQRFSSPPPPEQIDCLVRFLVDDEGFSKACARHFCQQHVPIRRLFWLTPRMAPLTGRPATWPVPALATTGALAEWLGITPGQLDWFADCRGWEAWTPPGPLRHYDYHWQTSSRGKRRLLERPRSRLKALQRRILHDILDHVSAHEAAHGYRRQRSIVTYATPHVGKAIVLRLDLRDFFPSIRVRRVRALFQTAGYPLEVARTLAGLCTNVVPADVWGEGERGAVRDCFSAAHLPQGAPTSPAVANLCAYRLDCRLAGLAAKVGASYTRYADDLAFSGDESFERLVRRFHVTACRIALEEGFEINTRKTRFLHRGGRQQLTGVVVNERVNCSRQAFDQLKAILTNCVRHGPAGQNREGAADYRSHLLGRIAHVTRLNAARGQRLRGLFERIDWTG